MSTVKYPNRKMYILAGLQPGEDATGGAWFTDGVLDQELMETLAGALEKRISTLSWKEVIDFEESSAGSGLDVPRKRNEPHDGFDYPTKGKEKMRRTDAEDAVPGSSGADGDDHHALSPEKQHKKTKRPQKTYVPYPAGYQKYPTLKDLTHFVNDNNIVPSGKIPENNISQLLDIMVYDDRVIKVKSIPDCSAPTMYKARRDYARIIAEEEINKRMQNQDLDEIGRMTAFRKFETKKLGNGGLTEIPCGRCPVFDMCEVGGPVNPNNCEYFEEWFEKLEDEDNGLTW
jgi:DNA-directed RNA polymerase III subunit RPC6